MARTPRRSTATPGATGEGTPRRVRENLPRPAAQAAGRGPQGTTLAPAPRRRSPLASLARLQPRFVTDIFSELRKVTWPTFAETRYLTIVVAIVASAVGLFLGGVDLAFGKIIESIFFT